MRCIYVIGPSSVGKSWLTSETADGLSIIRLDIDSTYKEIRRNWPLLEPSLRRHEEAPGDETRLVDIGAGTQAQAAHGLHQYLKSRAGRVVLVTDWPKRAWARNVRSLPGRTYEDYLDEEFSPMRKRLYDLAETVVHRRGRAIGRVLLEFEEQIVRLRSAPEIRF